VVFFSYPCSTDVSVIVEERSCLSYLELKSTLFAVRIHLVIQRLANKHGLLSYPCSTDVSVIVGESPRLSNLELKSTFFAMRFHLVIQRLAKERGLL
jgi:hypothetical protein